MGYVGKLFLVLFSGGSPKAGAYPGASNITAAMPCWAFKDHGGVATRSEIPVLGIAQCSFFARVIRIDTREVVVPAARNPPRSAVSSLATPIIMPRPGQNAVRPRLGRRGCFAYRDHRTIISKETP